MEKKLVLAIAFTLMSINFYSQPGGSGTTATGGGSGSGGGACITALFSELADCLSSHGVTYSIVSAGSQLYLYAQGSPPPGSITSCLVQYDNSSNDCPDAPVIINQTGSTGRKIAR